MTSTIIELRQNDASSEYRSTPGEWTNILPKAIKVDEGDQIVMKSCYIDTQAATTDRIVVDNPVKLSFSNGFYIDMVRSDLQSNAGIDNSGYVANTAQGFVDGKTYVLCNTVPDGTPNSFFFPGTTLQTSGDASGFPNSQDQTNATFTVKYFIPGQTTATTTTITLDDPTQYAPGIAPPGSDQSVTLPSSIKYFHNIVYDPTQNVDGTGSPLIFVGGSINSAAVDDTQVQITNNGNTIKLLQFISPGGFREKSQWEFDLIDPSSPTESAENLIGTPHIKSDPDLNSVVIPAGTYNETQLCTVINRQLQLNQTVDYGENSTSYINSNYLISYNPEYPGLANTKFIALDLSNATEYTANDLNNNANGGLLCGTTQIVLDYDQGAKQFMWSYIHMPYDGSDTGSGLNESAGVERTSNLVANNNKPIPVRRNAGIFFTDIQQVEYTGDVTITRNNGRYTISGGQERQFDFMGQKLKFDVNDLITPIKQVANPPTIGTLDFDKLAMPTSLAIGVKTTSGYFGLDAVVDRVDTDTWWHNPPDNIQFFSNIEGLTTPIYNSAPSGDTDSLNYGYMLIDVKAQFNNDFIGQNYNNNSIRAIVSRYYQQNTYTIGSQSDAVAYVHRGPPVLLQSFSTRILTGDKRVVPNLQTDNAVIIQIVKPQ